MKKEKKINPHEYYGPWNEALILLAPHFLKAASYRGHKARELARNALAQVAKYKTGGAKFVHADDYRLFRLSAAQEFATSAMVVDNIRRYSTIILSETMPNLFKLATKEPCLKKPRRWQHVPHEADYYPEL